MEFTAPLDVLTCRRLASLVVNGNWRLLSVLSCSYTFRNLIQILYSHRWDELAACIRDNAVSLEVFAEARGLDIHGPINRVADFLPSQSMHGEEKMIAIEPNSPLSYVVAQTHEEVHVKTDYEGIPQVSINENIYSPTHWDNIVKPEYWPTGKHYLSDPTLRMPNKKSACQVCSCRQICACGPLIHPLVRRPLVELHNDGSSCGTGVRALQYIAKDSILAEYVGVLQPPNYPDDEVYGMSFTPYNGKLHHEIATISAKKYGNWTRFMNHSCKYSIAFEEMLIGEKVRIMAVAKRDIQWGEEITVFYGKEYWRNKFCECGESCCTLSKEYVEKKLKRARV